MRKKIILMLLLSLQGFVFAQKQLTLDEAIVIALNKNINLQKSYANLERYESQLKSSYGRLLPNLNANASWSWNRSEYSAGVRYRDDVPVMVPEGSQESRTYSVGVSSSVTLFDGLSNWKSVSQSSKILDAAEYNLERIKQQIVFETTSKFYDVLNYRKVYEVKEENLKWNQKKLETIEEKNKLGATTLADLYQAKVAAGNAELDFVNSKNVYELAVSNFLNYLGVDVLEEIEFPDPSVNDASSFIDAELLMSEYSDLSRMVEIALNTRYDYKTFQLSYESASDGVTIARGDYYPNISARGSFGTSANKLGELNDSKTYSFGLSLNIPIFSGWSTEHSVQAAKVQEKSSLLDLENLEREIKIQLKTTFLELQTAKKRLEVSNNNVIAAEESRKINEEKYALGAGTLLDLLIANSNYFIALQENIKYKFDYLKLKSQLEYYLGNLDVAKYE